MTASQARLVERAHPKEAGRGKGSGSGSKYRRGSRVRTNFDSIFGGLSRSKRTQVATMSPQSERRPSDDRGEGQYGSRGGLRQQNYNTNAPSQYSSQSNGYGPPDAQQQRHLGPGPGQDPDANGYMQPPPSDSRNGRSRDMTQTLPTRERSRNDRTPRTVPSGTPAATPAAPPTTTKSASRTCKKCSESLTGQFVRALGGTFHLECFLCRVRRPFSIMLNTMYIILIFHSRIATRL